MAPLSISYVGDVLIRITMEIMMQLQGGWRGWSTWSTLGGQMGSIPIASAHLVTPLQSLGQRGDCEDDNDDDFDEG